jgi:hypothetical protein
MSRTTSLPNLNAERAAIPALAALALATLLQTATGVGYAADQAAADTQAHQANTLARVERVERRLVG